MVPTKNTLTADLTTERARLIRMRAALKTVAFESTLNTLDAVSGLCLVRSELRQDLAKIDAELSLRAVMFGRVAV